MNTANLIVACPDQKGLVATITKFIAQHGGNLVLLEQHIEDGHFFMRAEWDLADFKLKTKADFLEAFQIYQKNFALTFELAFPSGQTKRLGLFCSREPYVLMDILMRYQTGELKIEIPYVISNFENCRAFVERADIPFYYIPTGQGAMEHEQKQLEIIRQNPTDLIGLARYMKVLSDEMIRSIGQKIINVHHSFLPSFIGAKPYEEAYQRGVKMIGATAHYVTPDLDQGPIIQQAVRRVSHAQHVENLKLMGRESEKEVFAFALKKHFENKVVVYQNRTIVFN